MKSLKLKLSEPMDLVPTNLEKNLPLIGVTKYMLRTKNNTYQDFMGERNRQIADISYRQIKITLGLTLAGTLISGLLGFGYYH